MPLNTVDSDTLLRRMAAAIQSGVTTVINVGVGSILLAFIESVRDVAMWIQSLIMQLLQSSRLSTASGTDVDSFVADFGLTRLAAVAATGAVTFARSTTTQAAAIPAGTLLQTTDWTQSFIVIADATQAAWDATSDSYLIPIGTASVTATVQAVNAGIQGNVLANTVTVMTSPIQGVSTVTNAAAYLTGVDAESDTALKDRFALYLSGLKAGIKAAVASAIAGLQQGIQYTLVENYAYGGTVQDGYFYVVINPGTSQLQTAVYSAVDAIRPLGIAFGVFPASTLTANITMTAIAASGYTHAQIAADIQTAIETFIGTIGLGNPLYLTQLYAIAYGVAGVQEVTAMQINGGTADLTATAQQVIVSGSVSVS